MITRLIFYLLNACWQVLAVFLLGVGVTRLLRRTTAAVEYAVWVAILLAACLAPLLSLAPHTGIVSHAVVRQPQTATDFGLWLEGGARSSSGEAAIVHNWLPILLGGFAVYAIFVVAHFARLLVGLLQVRRIIASAKLCPSFELPQPHPALQRRLAESGCLLRISNTARVPFAFGLFRPSIVIPRYLLETADDERITAVLAHELAHVQRRDWIVNLLLLVLSTPLGFHPCIALIRRRVEACREAACDELAAAYMTSRLHYGRALLDLAGTFAKQQLSLAAAYKGAALGVLDGSALEDRIRRLMDRTPRLSAAKARMILFACMAGLVSLCIGLTSFALTLPSASSGSVAGVWTGKITDRNPRTGTATVVHNQAYLQLQQKGSQVTGAVGADADHSVPIDDAALNGNRLRFFATMKQGDETTRWTVDLVVNGDQMSGTGHALRSDQHSWDVEINLTRQP